jgi:hypothetical protein
VSGYIWVGGPFDGHRFADGAGGFVELVQETPGGWVVWRCPVRDGEAVWAERWRPPAVPAPRRRR